MDTGTVATATRQTVCRSDSETNGFLDAAAARSSARQAHSRQTVGQTDNHLVSKEWNTLAGWLIGSRQSPQHIGCKPIVLRKVFNRLVSLQHLLNSSNFDSLRQLRLSVKACVRV